MSLDYALIGKRIAQRRKALGLRQVEVCEKAGINDKYLSCIERATSIPSLDVLVKLAEALDTTPDTFLLGSLQLSDSGWKSVSPLLQSLSDEKLIIAKSFLKWLNVTEL